MRDVVERGAHRADEPFDLVEHRVEESCQVVEGIARSRARDPRIGAAGSNDPGDRGGERANRRHRRLRRNPSAAECDDYHRQRHESERGAEAREQIFAGLGALADLHQRSIAQPNRGDLQHRRIPRPGVAEHDRLGAAVEHADEQPLGRGPLLGADRVGERVDPAARVHRCVLAELAVDDLAVAPLDRRGRDPVGEKDDRDRADHEQRRVPEPEPQAEGVAEAAGAEIGYAITHG